LTKIFRDIADINLITINLIYVLIG